MLNKACIDELNNNIYKLSDSIEDIRSNILEVQIKVCNPPQFDNHIFLKNKFNQAQTHQKLQNSSLDFESTFNLKRQNKSYEQQRNKYSINNNTNKQSEYNKNLKIIQESDIDVSSINSHNNHENDIDSQQNQESKGVEYPKYHENDSNNRNNNIIKINDDDIKSQTNEKKITYQTSETNNFKHKNRDSDLSQNDTESIKNNNERDSVKGIDRKMSGFTNDFKMATSNAIMERLRECNYETKLLGNVKNNIMLNIKDKVNLVMKNRIETKMQDKIKNMMKFESDEQPGICLISDHDLNLIHANKNFCQTLFYLSEDLEDTNFLSYLDDDSKEMLDGLITSMIDESVQQTENIELFIQDKVNKRLPFKANIKQHFNIQLTTKPYFQIFLQFEDQDQWQIIDPLSPTQQIWTLLTVFMIVLLIFWIPQDVSFGGNELINNNLDLCSLFIFSLDIVMNFFVSQEEEGIIIKDISKIASNQVKGWMLFDLVATIPFDMFLKININTNFIKSIKVIKMLRLLRMFRINPMQWINFDELSKNEQGKEIIQLQRRNRGFFALLKNNFIIIISAHYQTILYYYMKVSQFEANNSRDWLVEQFRSDMINPTQSEVQFFLQYSNIKTPLGLAVLETSNEMEIFLSIFWMFFGLSLFGQGIGNISSYLNQANQVDIEQQDSISQFTDLCTQNRVDSRTQTLILNDIDKHQEKQGDKEFISRGEILSNNVFFQLETSLYRNFITSFKLLSQLDIPTVRTLKSQCHYNTEKMVLRMQSVASSVYFVTNGQIKIYDSLSNLMNIQKEHEIFGMEQFAELCKKKQDIDVENMIDNDDKIKEIKFKRAKSEKEKDNKKKQSILSDHNHNHNPELNTSINTQSNHNNTEKKQLMNDEFAKVTFPYSAIGNDEVKYIIVPYEILEDIMLQNPSAFKTIIEYTKHDLELIENADIEIYRKNMEQFSNSNLNIITVLYSGRVWDQNSVFSTFINETNLQMKGDLIQEHIDLNCAKQIDNIGDVLKLEVYKFKNVNQTIEIVNFFKNRIILDDEDDKIQQYKYKKSMLRSWILEFTIVKMD